jgi:serine/threonine-protein kinase
MVSKPRVLLAGVALLAAASQANAEDRAAAEALFAQGRALMQAKRYPEACAKLRQSLIAARGLGTMLWLADCYEQNGQLASAWRTFNEAAKIAAEKNDPREQAARRHAQTLEPKLNRLSIAVFPQQKVEGLRIEIDDVPIDEPEWIEAPVDAGAHVVRATAPGYKPLEMPIEVSMQSTVMTLPELKPLDANAAPKAVPATHPAPAASQAPAPGPKENEVTLGPPETSHLPLRTIGFVALGVGAVGLGLGTFFGFKAKSDFDSSNEGPCRQPGDFCSPAGLQLRSSADDAATVSTISFVAGGVLVAGGAALVIFAPTRQTAIAPQLSPTRAGLELRTAF